MDARHGGAFVFVPNSDTCSTFKDQILTDLDFGKALADFDVATAILNGEFNEVDVEWKKRRKEFFVRSSNWDVAKASLQTATHAIASLANVDGCVVLGRDLKVHCFAAKIQTGKSRRLPLVDYYDHSKDLESEMERLGTRNSSACMFCRENPGAIAFVISKDQDFRIYFSDDQYAYAFEDLWPTDQ